MDRSKPTPPEVEKIAKVILAELERQAAPNQPNIISGEMSSWNGWVQSDELLGTVTVDGTFDLRMIAAKVLQAVTEVRLTKVGSGDIYEHDTIAVPYTIAVP